MFCVHLVGVHACLGWSGQGRCTAYHTHLVFTWLGPQHSLHVMPASNYHSPSSIFLVRSLLCSPHLGLMYRSGMYLRQCWLPRISVHCSSSFLFSCVPSRLRTLILYFFYASTARSRAYTIMHHVSRATVLRWASCRCLCADSLFSLYLSQISIFRFGLISTPSRATGLLFCYWRLCLYILSPLAYL